MTVTVQTNVLKNSDGSAELAVGGTKVITSVSGPIEPKARQELANLASLEIVIRPSTGLATTREKLLEDKLRSLLQSVIVRYKYPRQLIQVVVQFLTSDGVSQSNEYTNNELSAAINCAYYALIDANVALYHSFASISACITDGVSITNPTLDQLKSSDSNHVVCFDIVDEQASKLLLLESMGDFTEEQVFELISTSVSECKEIHKLQRKYIAEKVDRDFIWKE